MLVPSVGASPSRCLCRKSQELTLRPNSVDGSPETRAVAACPRHPVTRGESAENEEEGR